MPGFDIKGGGPSADLKAPPAPGDLRASVEANIRSSIFGMLQPVVPGVPCFPDAIEQTTPAPAILYRLENVTPIMVMGDSADRGAVQVGSQGFMVFHSFDYDKAAAVQRAALIKQAFTGLRGPLDSVYITNSFKLVDETDAEFKPPDGSGRSEYEVKLTFSVGWAS